MSEETIRVLELGDTVFLPAARQAIFASQFKAAQTAGCPVKMAVQQRIVFRHR